MKSNWINRIFRSERNLSRVDIERYRKATDNTDRHDIEMQSAYSDFDNDAMDGWSEMDYDTSIMKRLDRKFSPSNSGYIILSGVLVVGVMFAGYIIFGDHSTVVNPSDQDDQHIQLSLEEGQEMYFDESDLVLPQQIEEMSTAPIEEQIKAESIKSDFQEKKSDPDLSPIELTLEDLPVLEIEIETQNLEPIREHFYAKEIYLHDLKLVDYRKYRSNPTVKTKQIILTGTPANQENEHSEDFEQTVRVLEIPYVEYLNKTMRYYNRNSYKRALARFETILATYNYDINANFYGGLCLFNLKEYDRAIKLFEHCINGKYSNFDEEAFWLIAQCYERNGNLDKASEIYSKIAEQNGFYSNHASEKLK